MRTLICYPLDPEPSPVEVKACFINAQQESSIIPTQLLFIPPFTRRSALLGWAQSRAIPWLDLPSPRSHSRSARLLYHQRVIDQSDSLIILRRTAIPSTHSDLLMRAIRRKLPVFVWFLSASPPTRPLVLADEVIWPDGCAPDPFEERQKWHTGDEDE